MTRPLRDVFGDWPYSITMTDEQREALRAAIDKQELPPMDDELMDELIAKASERAPLGNGNASQRIVRAVERYYGIHETEAFCPLCQQPVAAPPCSANSDGAFHLSHPHNPGRKTPRLFRFSGA